MPRSRSRSLLSKELGLIKDAVYEGGLAVVNVGDNCYISDILHFSRYYLENQGAKIQNFRFYY